MQLTKIQFHTTDLPEMMSFLSEVLLFEINDIHEDYFSAQVENLNLCVLKKADPSQLQFTFEVDNVDELVQRIQLLGYRGKNLGVLLSREKNELKWLDFENRLWTFFS